MRRYSTTWVVLVVMGLAWWSWDAAVGQTPTSRQRKPKPEKFDDALLKIFFDDIREQVGEGQPGGSGQVVNNPGVANSGTTPTTTPGTGGGSSTKWSEIISAATLEDEVKATNLLLAEAVQNPGKFRSKNLDARRYYTVLASVFGVIGQFDGDVRFKEQAPGLREQMAKAGVNCKVASSAAFQEAKRGHQDLEDLVRGSQIAVEEAPVDFKFFELSDRPVLMQRMEESYQRKLKPFTASKGDFMANSEEVLHEAEMLCLLAKIIQQEGYEYAEDAGYLQHAVQIEDACKAIRDAVKQMNYDAASKAVGDVDKACSNCHSDWRS